MQCHRSFLHRFMPYGAPDLLDAAPSHMLRGVTMGSALWVALYLAALIVVPHLPRIEVMPPPTIDVMPRVDMPLPPKLVEPAPPTRVARAEPTLSMPIPVPVSEVPPVDEVEPPPSTGLGNGTDSAPKGIEPSMATGIGTIEHDPPPNQWVPRDVEAEVVIQIKPDYPQLALDARVEGVVRLRALVGTDGRVRRVIVDRSVPMLDEAARTALMKWVFTPALYQGRPVAVWVAVPFRFTIR